MLPFLSFCAALVLITQLQLFPGWFDSGEFSVAAVTLGVSHPTGHPLYVQVAHFFSWIPLASIDFRVSLLSALSLVAGLTLVARLGSELSTRRREVTALFIFLVLFFHPSLALQGTRSEVYSLQFFLSVLSLFLGYRALVQNDLRHLIGAAFVAGLAFAVQPLLTALLLPPLLVVLFSGPGRRVPRVGSFLGFGGLGFLAYLFLPFRAATNPALNWDHPSVWSRFLGAFTARDFRIFFHGPLSERARSDLLGAEILEVLPLAALFGAGLGVFWLLKRSGSRMALYFGSALLCSGFSLVLKDFYLKNPDAHAYIMLPIGLAVALLVCGTVHFLSNTLHRTWLALAAAASILVLIFGSIGIKSPPAWASHGNKEALLLSRHLDKLPPRASIQATSDHWVFPLWYRSLAEGRRPDVAILGQGLLHASWYIEQERKRDRRLHPQRRWWEKSDDSTLIVDGFLFGPHPTGASHVANRVSNTCQEPQIRDPFLIRRSICAQLALTRHYHLLNMGQPETALRTTENFLGLSIPSLTCSKPKDIELPFPLYHGRDATFLPEPVQVFSELAVLYIRCGQLNAARRSLAMSSLDSAINPRLLRSYVAWAGGHPEEAIKLLSSPSDSWTKAQAGHLWLARAFLEVYSGKKDEARGSMAKARQRLGDSAYLRQLSALIKRVSAHE